MRRTKFGGTTIDGLLNRAMSVAIGTKSLIAISNVVIWSLSLLVGLTNAASLASFLARPFNFGVLDASGDEPDTDWMFVNGKPQCLTVPASQLTILPVSILYCL